MANQISPLPTPPQRNDPASFAARGDAFLAALPDFQAQANALATGVEDDADRAEQAAQDASTAKGQADDAKDAAALSAQAAANKAAEAQASAEQLAELDALYLGAALSDPATGKEGAPLVAGNFYINSTTGFIRAFDGSQWVQGIASVAGVSSLDGQVGGLSLKTVGGSSLLGLGDINVSPVLLRIERTGDIELTGADVSKFVDVTAGTFTQTFEAAATLGDGWWCYLRNNGSGEITIPTSDGRTNWIMYPGELRLFQCDGSVLRSIVIRPFKVTFTQSGNFIKPPGYHDFGYMLWSAGGAGAVGQSGGEGGACAVGMISSTVIGDTTAFIIGAGGSGIAGPVGNDGGDSSFGSLIHCIGGAGGRSSVMMRSAAWATTTNAGVTTTGSNPTSSNSLYGGGVPAFDTAAAAITVYGGGGGGKAAQGAKSIHGGQGGFNGSDATAPGGGGSAVAAGTSKPGARGELRIWGTV